MENVIQVRVLSKAKLEEALIAHDYSPEPTAWESITWEAPANAFYRWNVTEDMFLLCDNLIMVKIRSGTPIAIYQVDIKGNGWHIWMLDEVSQKKINLRLKLDKI